MMSSARLIWTDVFARHKRGVGTSAAGAGECNLRSWAAKTPAEFYVLSVVTVQELERGTLLIERRDAKQGAILRRWLEAEVLAKLGARTLSIDIAIARQCAHLHVPDPRQERDALIAATALVHGLTVVTRNTADFEPMGVALLNPWAAAGA